MEEKSINSTGMKTLTNVKAPGNLITLKNNKSFCNYFIKHNSMTLLVDGQEEYESPESKLIYDYSGTSSIYEDVLGKIIDLLFQLRAAQSDQNVFVQNNTVVREQILNQLQNEILKVNHKLSKNQIKNLEVISSNSFDEDKLNEILKSFLESSKKKSLTDDSESRFPKNLNNINLRTLENIKKTYSSVLSAVINNKTFTHRIFNNQEYKDKIFRTELINIKHPKRENAEISPKSPNRAYSGELINRNLIFDSKEIIPESTQFYEENIIKNISKVYPEIKSTKKLTHVDFLTKVNSFVKNITESKKPETKEVHRSIKKVKDIYKDSTVFDSVNILDVSNELINRKSINVESENQKSSETERQNFKKYNYLISNKFNEIIKDKNIISKEFRIKNQRYQRIIDVVKNRNNTVLQESLNIKKLSESFLTDSKSLVYKNINVESENIEDTDYKTIINKILETKYKKDIKNQNKEIQKNINVLKQSEIHEKYKIKSNKTYQEEFYYENPKPLTHKIESINLDSEIVRKEDIYKVIPKFKNETKLVKTKVQNEVFRNVTRFLKPIVNKRSSFSTVSEEFTREHLSKKLTHLNDKVGNVQERILINDDYKVPEPVYKSPTENYMIYKEEASKNAPPIIEKKENPTKQTQKQAPKKEVKKAPPVKEPDLNLSKVKKEILASTLKREDVERMIEAQMSRINVNSISRIVVEDVKRFMELEKMRNGIFD